MMDMDSLIKVVLPHVILNPSTHRMCINDGVRVVQRQDLTASRVIGYLTNLGRSGL